MSTKTEQEQLNEINDTYAKLAKTIVRATITDWTGKVLFESENYNEALEKYFSYDDDDDDIQLNSYDTDGTNHGIFY